MSTVQSKKNRVSLVQQLLAGTNKHFPNASQELTVGGVKRTVGALTQLLQGYVNLRTAVAASQAATKTQVATERAQAPSLLAIVDEFEAFVRASFGKQPDVLADFGLAPPKARAPLTAEQKAIATAKRKATRQARHTASKKQKKNVKGAVNAALVVTPVSASTPAAAPAAATAPVAPGDHTTGGGSTPHGA